MRKWMILVAVVLVIYAGYRAYRFYTLQEGLEKIIATGKATILDVRTAAEFNTGHIEGAINISLGEIRERYIELDTAKTYITVCSHGLRSVKAEKLLKERGFKKVYNGGAWSDLQNLLNKSK